MMFGDKIVRSSNHHSLVKHGLIVSGVLVDMEHLKPVVSGDEEDEEQEGIGVGVVAKVSNDGSEFAEILARREEISLSRRPEESAMEKKGSQVLRDVKMSSHVQ